MNQDMPQPYRSQIIKASALIPDTRVLLLNWDFEQSIDANMQRAREDNLFAKASRSRVSDILPIFRQRYFSEPNIGAMLATVAEQPGHARTLERLLYFYAARADRLLHDTVTMFLAPRHASGFDELLPVDLRLHIQEWVNEGRMTTHWGASTVARVTQGLMATLRDFGVLEGRIRKRIVSQTLPIEAFVLIATALAADGVRGDRLLVHPDWQLFFLDEPAVERLFMEAHQRHLLEYHAAGSTRRITFPSTDLVEVARAITR